MGFSIPNHKYKLSNIPFGFISGGYINKDIAVAELKRAVRNNAYLNGNSSSGALKIYLKGAGGAFTKGELEPLQWDKLL